MNPRLRELTFKVIDGKPEILNLMYQFHKFKYAQEILQYFVSQNLTGQKFLDCYQHEFKMSWLSMGKWAIMKLRKEREFRPVIAGKDFASI